MKRYLFLLLFYVVKINIFQMYDPVLDSTVENIISVVKQETQSGPHVKYRMINT